MATAIIIAGMHRSGTSATTGALRLSGISLGKGLLEAAPDNPKGFFENERAVQIHEKLLSELGYSWDDVRELPAGWMTTAAAAEARAGIHRLIETEFAGDELWAVKDPRICRLIPLWREVLEKIGINVVSLHVVRRPGEVAASISARNGWDRKLGELLWMRHVFEAEATTRDIPRAVISYETLLKEPATSIARALGQLGVVIDVEAQAASELTGFVDTKDRHHIDRSIGGADDDALSNLMNAAYAGLVDIERGTGGWKAVQDLAQQSRDLLHTCEPYIAAVAGKAARHFSDFLGMEVRKYEVQSALNAQIAWSEEAVLREQHLGAHREELMGVLKDQATSLRELTQEHAKWAAERALLEDERDHSHELVRQLRVRLQNELLVAENAKLGAMLSGGDEKLNALVDAHGASLGQAVSSLAQDIHSLAEKNAHLNHELREYALKMEAVNRSLSWRFTRPLRVAANYMRTMLGRTRTLN